ncbi:hypothetical protein AB0892_15395 [Streptomyces sp. NPDC005409]|uniref:hypothetical protein n=1 Tax=Streptomyces sp. NPDC005409 TaxID=3155342 RepID=UPI003452FF2D
MPVSAGLRRGLGVVAVAAVLLAGATGCADGVGDGTAAAPAAAYSPASTSPSPSATAMASESASAAASASPSGPVPPSAPSTTRATTPPAVPTRLTVAVDTRGGRLALVRGGAPQEFTVTLRNGNSAAYRHLLVAFQMEFLVGEPGDQPGSGPGFLLERFDPASGAWRPAALRVANDAKSPAGFTGGAPLARETVRVERYRLSATAGGPTGSTPVMVSFIDTDGDREAAAHVNVGHSTR